MLIESRFVNGLPGFASALADRSPILIITSSPPLRDTETNNIQGFIDQIDVGRRLTKYAQKVPQPEEIPRFIAHAYRIAISGAPGKELSLLDIQLLTGAPQGPSCWIFHVMSCSGL